MKTILSKTAVNTGLLIIRAGIGIMFITHGFPKLSGGPAFWEAIGGTMGIIGLNFWPVFWGFMAAFAETIGGLFLTLGLFTRPAAFLMLFTMLMATLTHFTKGDGLQIASHAIESGLVFLGFLVGGAGRYSLDHLIFGGKKK